ncbi:uncharacterized protein J4E78_008764 [Alternaria triticimaculans]|uniref:uncharacterized protein n=1 Tax=Alternaria triticimaculans TaxID=297637 RepID=UPI0020C38EE8|nr:uncharacterized protein J4E78_008764 [Alternaria triticimaculans]KAI4648701.1 hypothetical protein J4E78_008764 [Alternaria triticimaculans]
MLCTDKDWKAEGCASNMCTISNGDVKAVGGESITQCKDHDDQWCCNADAVNVNCCKESPSPRPFFALQDGKAYATIGQNQASTAPNLATITGLAQSGGGSGGGNQASKTTAGGSSGSPSTDAPNSGSATATADDAATTPFSSVIQSLSTSAGGGVVTIQNTVLVTPTPTAGSSSSNNDSSSSSSGGSKSNLGLIIGCAVGIPLALALVGIIFWLLRKRRQQKANPYHDPSSEVEGDSPLVGAAAAGKLNKSKKETYRNSRPATAEIDGNPIGAGRANRVSELPSGNGFQPGHQGTPYGPDVVGIGGGNGDPNRTTWDTIPPQYSPASNQAAFATHAHPEAMELADTSVNPVLNEKGQPYQAYRPPQPVAELPSVTTPPEDVEKQMHHR